MRKTAKLAVLLLAVLMMFVPVMSFTGCNEVANDIVGEIGAELGNELDRIIADEVGDYIAKGIEQYENIYVEAVENPLTADENTPFSKTVSDDELQTFSEETTVIQTDSDSVNNADSAVMPKEADISEMTESSEEDNIPGLTESPEVSGTPEEIKVPEEVSDPVEASDDTPEIDPDGTYTTKQDVALYIHTYGKLPSNFITKNEARELGWNGGGLEDFAPGKCIGGDRFGNYEELLPTKKGRRYTECDIDTLGKDSRGAKRIVFSNDGLVYYTDDHYDSFTLLYGEEN